MEWGGVWGGPSSLAPSIKMEINYPTFAVDMTGSQILGSTDESGRASVLSFRPCS